MPHKVILITDAGIDGAFAVALAMHDESLDVVGLVASAGNVSAEQATRNIQIFVEQMDPPRWPRLGSALPVEHHSNGSSVHGPNGLGGVEFPCADLHHEHAGDKLISDLLRQSPNDISIAVLGPATTLAATLERDPEALDLINRVILVGGTWREPGDASAVAEFHFASDPVSARKILRAPLPIIMLPLDVTRKIVFSPSDLLQDENTLSPTCQFLRKIVPHGIGASAGLFGIEGFYLLDALAIAALSQPDTIRTQRMAVDVETRGELTRGMSVVDTRWGISARHNIEMAVDVDVQAVRQYISRVLYLRS